MDSKKEFGEVLTPDNLIYEMLNCLPEEVWLNENYKWLEPSCGNGNFLNITKQKLLKNISEESIIKNILYGIEIQENLFNECKTRTNIVNLKNSDFLSEKFTHKFDIVFGNPPYNNKRNISNNQSRDIYIQFIEKCFELSNKYVLMVTPSRWFMKNTYGNKEFRNNMIKNYGLKILMNKNPLKEFKINIEGGISYFLLEKGYRGKVNFDGVMRDFSNSQYIFKNDEIYIEEHIKNNINVKKITDIFISQIAFGIKTNDTRLDDDGMLCKFSDRKGGFKKVSHSIVNRDGLIFKWKVCLPSARGCNYPLIGQYFILPPEVIFSESFCGFYFNTKQECENFIKYMEREDINKLIMAKKIKQHLTKDVFSLVPLLDFN